MLPDSIRREIRAEVLGIEWQTTKRQLLSDPRDITEEEIDSLTSGSRLIAPEAPFSQYTWRRSRTYNNAREAR